MPAKKRVGIVMFQLGGPDSLAAVEPFLLNLFLDPDIIPLGPLGLLRKPIAKSISSRRSKPVMGRYAQIGRRSPIATIATTPTGVATAKTHRRRTIPTNCGAEIRVQHRI